MRIETNTVLLIGLTLLFGVVWLITRHRQPRRLFIVSISVIGALLLPGYVPGHGEIVLIIPNATLFTVDNHFVWGLGTVFGIINYCVLSLLLNRLSRHPVH